ncbi:hypothetical protein RvY_12030 [Ramazzottius varieornatus]|uniref:Uncharacterized protein n=1 Tax=Ramazzottius varieornatus TaxID=947166 RepID=A0A1D1VMD2_RAMVA|nr:hypothetical protein RvY_12030 [Ramazzottius varieornatus]
MAVIGPTNTYKMVILTATASVPGRPAFKQLCPDQITKSAMKTIMKTSTLPLSVSDSNATTMQGVRWKIGSAYDGPADANARQSVDGNSSYSLALNDDTGKALPLL